MPYALEVDDIRPAMEYLVAKGVKVAREAVDLADSWRAEVLDPDGLCIELREWKEMK